MLRRVHIKGFKSLHDVEVRFAPLVVLLGPNAAGKSNLLEALLLLSRSATQRTLAEAFDALRGFPHEAFELPDGGLEAMLRQPRAELAMEVDVEPASTAPRKRMEPLRYRLGARIRPANGALEVADEYLCRLTQGLTVKGLPRLEAVCDSEPSTGDGVREPESRYGPGRLAVRQLGRAGRPAFQELGLGHTVLSNRQFGGETRYPDFDRMRLELAAWRLYYLDPRVSMRQPQAPRETHDIGQRGELIAPYLFNLKQDPALKPFFDGVRRALHSAIPSIDDLDVDLDPKRGLLDIRIRQDGIAYPSRVISEGTLRVLALCALAANPHPPSLVAFEEPENGVHPRRLDVIAALLASMSRDGHTQVVVTTHSPALVAAIAEHQRQARDRDSIAMLVCAQEGRRTRITPFDMTRPLFDELEIEDALAGEEDEALIAKVMKCGWLDG